MSVSEFLRHVRRIVVDFVVGQVLSHNGKAESASGLDDLTTYYILRRYDFGLQDAPIGACILYAISCGLSDRDLCDRYDLLVRTGGQAEEEEEEKPAEEAEEAESSSSGARVKLTAWSQRYRKSLGLETDGRPAPLIDQIHRLMHLWRAGDAVKVDEYLDSRALRRNNLFAHVLQALIELARDQRQAEECSILESLSNHVAARGVAVENGARQKAQREIKMTGTIRID